MTALQIAEITSLNRNTVNRYLKLTRTVVANFCEQESPFSGEIQCDESYFGSRYQSGRGGRGAGNKHIVFGIYKRNGKVYTEIVENLKAKTLQQIIKGKVSFDSILYTDGFRCFGFDCPSRLSEAFSDLPSAQFTFKVMFTLTASRASGDTLKFALSNFAVYQRTLFICT